MRTVVVVPTYNEADGIVALLDRVLRLAADVDVLVVDDSSPDGTSDVVGAHPDHGGRVQLLVRPGRQGLGPAYRAGFAWALDAGYDAVVQMDADLSHPPERLPALLAALEHADVAVGSRYVRGGGVRDWPLTRRAISRAGNLFVRMVLRTTVNDATSGFKAFRRGALLRILSARSESNGYCFQIETLWRADRIGLHVTEVPITFTDRTLGESKMSAAIIGEAMLRVLTWRWRELLEPTVFGTPEDRHRVGA
jgi:dolichol-phosphate mannosyltransferase